MNTRLLLGLGIAVCLAMTSCKKDEPEDPIIPNEEELITTLSYTLEPINGGTNVVLTFQDLDGDGGDAPLISVSGPLTSGDTYVGQLTLLDETSTPVGDISEEVEEEAEEHQFFFAVDGVDASVSYSDSDADGNPIGLSSQLVAGAASTGTLQITLRHEPDKNAAGVSDGLITNAGGETDIEVSFDIEIQ
jgi:hypothetical protein